MKKHEGQMAMNRYEQIALDLQNIVDEKLKRNDIRFPTEAELGRQFQVSRVTIRRALAILEEKGLLVRRQGSGCFLTGRAPDSSGNQLALLLSSPFSYRSPGIVNGVRRIASREGFLLSVYDMRSSLQTERQILTDFLSSAPRGLILEDFSSIPNPNSDLLEQLATQDSRVPVVSLFGSHGMEASRGNGIQNGSFCRIFLPPLDFFCLREFIAGSWNSCPGADSSRT